MMVESDDARRADAGTLKEQHLALPFWIKQIPVGFKLLEVNQTRVVVKPVAGDAAFIHEDELLFAVRVEVFTVEPLRAVNDFRQKQYRLKWIEHAGFVEIKKRSSAQAAAVNVGKKFPGAALGDDARHQITDPPAHADGFDERKFFGKCRNDVGMRDFL